MRRYRNKYFDIALNLPDNWRAIDNPEVFVTTLRMTEEDMENMSFFLVEINDNVITKCISVTHEPFIFENQSDFFYAVQANIDTLQEYGSGILSQKSTRTDFGYLCYKIVAVSGSVLQSLYMVYINDIFLCFSGEIGQENDSADMNLYRIVSSIHSTEELSITNN